MTITRRDAIASFALLSELVASTRLAEAQTQAAPPAGRPPVFTHDLPDVMLDGWEVTVSYVDYPPGRVGAVHHHAGFVLAYVLEGAVVTKISGRARSEHTRPDRCFTSSPARHTRFRKMRARRSPRSSSR